jgi:hypothetical protein
MKVGDLVTFSLPASNRVFDAVGIVIGIDKSVGAFIQWSDGMRTGDTIYNLLNDENHSVYCL